MDYIETAKTGVHRTHCCVRHGCKYADDDCPVALGYVVQEFPCEVCGGTSAEGGLTYEVRLIIKKEATSEVEGLGWMPTSGEVAALIREQLEGRDFDRGWVISEVWS